MRNITQEIKRLEFQLQTFTQRILIDSSRLNLANVNTSVILNNFAAAFEANITARMAGRIIQTYKHPKTWLDAFKLRWFPKFLITKYPAEYVTVTTWQCYPEYPIHNLGQPIQFLILENESYDKITS